MAFHGYKGDVGECYWTPYSTSSYYYDYDYDVISPQDSVTYTSLNEFDQSKLIEHSPYNYFDSSATEQIPNYLVYNYTPQKVIQYEPPPYVSASFYSNASSSVSTVEFAEPMFEEYDPTPYGGGYDIAQTYGKPLPPSDKTCYPRSTPQANLQLPVPHGSSLGLIPSANGHDDDQSAKPHKDKDSESAGNQEKQNHSGNGDKVKNESGNTEDLDLQKPIEIKVSDVDEHPSSDYNNACGYDWNRQVPYTPYGSGLEAIDLCESIFGYWPCLAKINRERNANCVVCNEESQNEPWKSAADYLFGSPFGYGEQNNGDRGYHFYTDGSYYQHQPQYPNEQGT